MHKFNAQSILSLRDEPLKKEKSVITGQGKENLKMNSMQNDQILLIKDVKESTKKKYRRSVLRREAEKSLSKDDDLLWNPSFTSISSLPQVQSNTSKDEKPQLGDIEKSINETNQPKDQDASSTEISLDFIDEVIDICMALNRRPVRASSIERLLRLQSRPDFKFRKLVEINSQAIGSICLRLTSNLALAAQDLVEKIPITNDDQNLRELNALLSSLQILYKAFLEIGSENEDHKNMIDSILIFSLAKKCLDELKKENKCIQTKNCYNVKRQIQEEATKLFEIIRPNN